MTESIRPLMATLAEPTCTEEQMPWGTPEPYGVQLEGSRRILPRTDREAVQSCADRWYPRTDIASGLADVRRLLGPRFGLFG